MPSKKVFILIAIVLIQALAAWAQTKPGASVVRPTDEAPRLKPQAEDRYTLVPGDVIEISYRYTPEFNQTLTIQPDGYVSLQLVGDLKIGGVTLDAAHKMIIQKASVRLKDPEITLLLKEFQKPYFVVAGEVAAAGRFEMRENVTALQAIMLAGGFKESAYSSQVVIFRKLNEEVAEVRTLDLKSVRKTSDLENDLRLRSGDIVYIPRNKLSKFERYMRLANVGAMLAPLTWF